MVLLSRISLKGSINSLHFPESARSHQAPSDRAHRRERRRPRCAAAKAAT